MPLRITSLPNAVSKGSLLRWILDTGEVRKQQVGAIEIRGREAVIELPDSAGARVAKRLEGQVLMGRRPQVWYETEASKDEGTDHFRQLTRWLEMEERAELEEAAEWLRASGGNDSSTSLRDLVVRGEDTGLGGFTLLTLERRNSRQALPATQLDVGRPVLVSEQSQSSLDRRRGVVTRLEQTQIEVALAKAFVSLDPAALVRIDLAEDEITMQRCRAALSKAAHARGDRLSELRSILLGEQEPQFGPLPQLQFLDPNLNNSQRAAISFALSARDLAIIHGPPGTGKTTTLVELIRQAIRRGDKVLAAAPSNLGVDNLFERLLNRGESAVRVGHTVRVLPHLRDHTLRALAQTHRDVRRVKSLRTDAAALFRKADRSSSGAARNVVREEAKALLAEARATESAIVESILQGASVICTTNTGLDADWLGAVRFDLVVIDEACQCTEAACWVPLLRAGRLVLAGDHCQLPPIILSPEAAREGFAVSLQERLVELYGEKIARPLLVQYRMHDQIMAFSSSEFYGGTLQAHPSVAGHRLCDRSGVKPGNLTSEPVLFIDTSGAGYDEEKEIAGSSWRNLEEAALAAKKVRDLMECGVPSADIAIITPYTAQVQALRDQLNNDAIEVGTVDGFQGREKEAVVISLVRSNKNKEIGFLKDTRRMNVALTRARRKLIVIGDSATISGHPFYDRLLEHFDKIQAYHVVWEEES